MSKQQNLAARAGRWSAAHWKSATLAWVAFVVVAVGIGYAVGIVNLSDSEQSTGETSRAQAILARADFKTPAGESVLIKSTSLTASSPVFRSTVADVVAKLRTMPQVTNLRTGADQISSDRHAQLVQFDMKGSIDTALERVQPLIDAVAGLQKAHPASRSPSSASRARTRTERHDRQGLSEGRDALAADHVPDPALRLRRVRRRRRAGAARLLRRARLDRAREAREPRLRMRPTRHNP